MKRSSDSVLAKGLQAGFATTGTVHHVARGSFALNSTDVSLSETGAAYSDQWMMKRVGGGQEIACSGTDVSTRVYAGGIIAPEKLSALRITEAQVLGYLKKYLSQYAGTTRLHEPVASVPDGDWHYRYTIMKDYPDIPLTIGIETIMYKGNEVFIHVFLVTPVA